MELLIGIVAGAGGTVIGGVIVAAFGALRIKPALKTFADDLIAKVESIRSDLGDRIDRLDDRIDRLDDRIDRLDDRIDRLDGRSDAFTTRLDAISAAFVASIGEQSKRIDDLGASLRADIQARTSRIADLTLALGDTLGRLRVVEHSTTH